MKDAICVEGLKKSYGSHAVLKGVSFRVRQGEIFALLGVNGAGKTTTLESLEGLRSYDDGRVTVQGKMGIQLQSASLPEHIRAMEAITLFAKWNGVRADGRMLNALGVDTFAKKQYNALSTGQKRRLHLALALVHDPDVVFLDEPTAGLDVEGRILLHQEIRKLQERGKTIMLASHDMAEVESLCDRIAILKEGTIAFTGTAEELTATIGKRCMVRIKTEQGEEQINTDNIRDALLVRLEEHRRTGVEVLDIQVDRGTLEQHFITISRGDEA